MALSKERIQKILATRSTVLGLLLYIVGLTWFCLLSQDELNFETYISENALLVGQVVERFDDVPAIAAYERQLVSLYAKGDTFTLRQWLRTELLVIGLEVYEQNFTFQHNILHPIEQIDGTNLYAIMRSPSGGRTEALLLTVPLKTDCSPMTSPCLSPTVGLLISLMKLFRQQVYWAKDIVVVFIDSDYIGLLAWLEAYHGRGASEYLSWSELEGRSGNIQAGLNLEFSHSTPSSIDILPEGTNGFLANLDLVNTVVRLANKHSIEPVVNGQSFSTFRGEMNIRKGDALGLLKAVWTQASGSPSGLHGLLISYQIPAVTLRGPSRNHVSFSTSRQSSQLGKLIEGILRSLNNLQERLHQSFWYYLLPNPMRYISIGVYMPPVLILIGSLLIKTIGFWCAITDSKEESQKPSEAAPVPGDNQNSDPTSFDPDQHIRKRTQSTGHNEKTKKDRKHSRANKLSAAKDADAIPPTLSRLAVWIVIPFACGLFLHVSPKLLFRLYAHPEWETVQHMLNIQPLLSESLALGLLGLFCLSMLLSPVLVTICYHCFIDEVESILPLANSILLIAWTLFLTCMACLNVSASFLLSLVVVPILLVFVRLVANPKVLSCLFGLLWLIVSPPILLFAVCYIHVNFFEETTMTPVNGFNLSALNECASRILVQGLIECNLFGSWGWSVLTCGYSSLWLLTWIGICCN